MLTDMLVRNRLSRRLLQIAGTRRTDDIVSELLPHIPVGSTVIDIGAGTCDVAARLIDHGRHVIPVDVRSVSCVDSLAPVLFDGHTLPFADDSFEWALLVDVLHHTDPERLLCEAARVSSRIIVHEDIFTSRTQMLLTFAMDSITNLEFVGHPHSNKSDAGWRRLFRIHGLTVQHASQRDFWRAFTCATYVLRVHR
ncbi:MAG: methyltransferase domain-containing protein [Myxococcales bacterium]|nr:methyltransferase domain-containing protein [Myxococcales bacterium]